MTLDGVKESKEDFSIMWLKLKIRQIYQNVLYSCGIKHVIWKVEIKELPKKIETV